VRCAGRGQRVEHGSRQALAGSPDLQGDDLVGARVVVDQAPADLRFSTCKDIDSELMNRMISRTGERRFTYRRPAGA